MPCIKLFKAESEGSLSVVVELVGYQLRELELRRAEVSRRIHDLYIAIAALKKFSGPSNERGFFGEDLVVVERPVASGELVSRIQRSKQP